MEAQDAIDIGRHAIATAMLIGSPVLAVGLITGLLIGILQALTQVNDQTVSFVPKIVCMLIAISICLPWLIQTMMDYSHTLISEIPRTVMGG